MELSVSTEEDSAIEETDYPAATYNLTLAPGQDIACLSVNTLEDNFVEDEEAFQLTLSSDDLAVIISSPAAAIVHISDDDSKFESPIVVRPAVTLISFFRCDNWV